MSVPQMPIRCTRHAGFARSGCRGFGDFVPREFQRPFEYNGLHARLSGGDRVAGGDGDNLILLS